MFGLGARLFFKAYRTARRRARYLGGGQAVDVALQHPEGRSEINELHIPLGRAVKLTMISHDVIHSFYVPAFRVKQDVLPGRYTTMWFEPTKTGRYHLFCAEYCGTNHSTMAAGVTVMEPADFQQWLSAGRDRALDGRGGRAPLRPAPLCGLPSGQPDRARTETGGGFRPAGADPGGQRGSFCHCR